MQFTAEQIRRAAAEARGSLTRGSLARADLICQSILAGGVKPPEILAVLADVAARVGLPPPASGRPRFHLIQAWGFGFASDVYHVLSHLLLAEMTGRTPVVNWAAGSLFRDAGTENAWPVFFEPVSSVSARDLVGRGHRYFPDVWNDAAVLARLGGSSSPPKSRVPGIAFLNQSADVTVADFHAGVIELLPWVRPPHALAPIGPVTGLVVGHACRALAAKYLKPRADVMTEVDRFAAEHFAGHEVAAVHVRGSDKVGEVPNLAAGHRALRQKVDALVADHPDVRVFLLTDSTAALAEYVAAFGDRIITTRCSRSTNAQGVHYLPAASRERIGKEVLLDILLAARCDRLLGLGCTNVSNLTFHLKTWPPGTADLLGAIMVYQRHLAVHPC